MFFLTMSSYSRNRQKALGRKNKLGNDGGPFCLQGVIGLSYKVAVGADNRVHTLRHRNAKKRIPVKTQDLALNVGDPWPAEKPP
jgi:hypothetical protein